MLGFIGRNNLTSSSDVRSGFGIKVTLTLCLASGIYPKVRQDVMILTSSPDKIPIPFFKSAGKIPCPPADLKGTKTLI
jgi:hypothetical protein